MPFFKRKNNDGTQKSFFGLYVAAGLLAVTAGAGALALATGAVATVGMAAGVGAMTLGGIGIGSGIGIALGFTGGALDEKYNNSANHHGFAGMGRFITALFIGGCAGAIGGAYGGYKLATFTFGDHDNKAKTAFNATAQATPAYDRNTLVLTAKDFAPKK